MMGDGNELKEEGVEGLINEFRYPIYLQHQQRIVSKDSPEPI